MKNNTLIFFILLLCIVFHAVWIQHHAWQLPTTLIEKPVIINGLIDSIPQKKFHGIQFQFHAIQINHQAINSHFLIAWYQQAPRIQVGQRWQLTVKLKPPVGTHNPGGFDYAAFLMHHGISATGYVLLDKHNQHTGQSPFYFIDIFREKMQSQIFSAIHNRTIAAFVSALSVGLRDGLNENDWQVFQKTGTNHLVAIAGLHIEFVAATIYFFINFIWRLFPALLLKIPAAWIAELCALIGALGYTALSGFAIPAQRASIMLFFLMSSKLLHRHISVWKRLWLAALIILLLYPDDRVNASFWLSFSAISVLAWVLSGRLKSYRGVKSWIRMQSAMIVGILPWTILFFQQTSVIAFFTNAIAIPWVGFLILPLCLLACLLSLCHLFFLSQPIFWLTGKVISPLWKLLCAASQLSFSSWHHAVINNWVLFASVIGVIFLLAPRGFYHKWLGCFGLLPFFFYHPSMPIMGEYWVIVIDVGQGLSVLVQTTHHVMLYDTGAHVQGGFDFGESVVAPLLRNQAIQTIDRLEISHGDNDHSGGAAAIIRDFHVKAVVTSAPNLVRRFHAQYCIAGQSWTWDEVHFTTLNPAANSPYADNNSSCVIKVNNGSNALLLTGDIEAQTEFSLVSNNNDQLRSTVLVVPHHGSRTSSSEIFLNAVSPHYAIISAGKYNRYHLPAQSVLSRYASHYVKLYVTADDGAINIRFLPDGQVKLQPMLKKA